MTSWEKMAYGRFSDSKYKSKLEAEYAGYLELLKKAGEIVWYKHEGWKVRLGEGAYYLADFAVMTKTGALEFHEVKGFWREAAKIRIRVAAEMYPMPFKAVTRGERGYGTWKIEIF